MRGSGPLPDTLFFRQIRAVTVEGRLYSVVDFNAGRRPEFASRSSFHRELSDFLADWFSAETSLTVQTSGSTGRPRRLLVLKERLWNSAGLTCQFLGLQAGQSALLCLPLRYIAGKMLVVRALRARLDLQLVEPDGHPLRTVETTPYVAAFTPQQIFNTLGSEQETERLKAIRQVLIGGGAVSGQLAEQLRSFPSAVYSTYGLTETLSHIALCRLSGPEASDRYRPLPGVRLALSSDGTLVIEAPAVAEGLIVTNDLAALALDGSFKILGRMDNVINTGGFKVGVEELEEALSTVMPAPFAITAAPDEKFGEVIVLVLAKNYVSRQQPGGSSLAELGRRAVVQLVEGGKISAFQVPRRIVLVNELPLTETGKPARAKIRALVGAASDCLSGWK